MILDRIASMKLSCKRSYGAFNINVDRHCQNKDGCKREPEIEIHAIRVISIIMITMLTLRSWVSGE